MTIHMDDFITGKDGRRRYLVTCDEILPNTHPNRARRGTVCGARRYLRITDAKRSKMCFSCAQRIKGKKAYQVSTAVVQALGYDSLPLPYLQKNPSKPERILMRLLDKAQIAYETNIRVPGCDRQWLMDIFVKPNLCIEIDDTWIHERRCEDDAEKDADMTAAGIQFMRISIRASRNVTRQLEAKLPDILSFLGVKQHGNF